MLYVTITTALLAIIVWFIPKHIPKKDLLVAWITVSFVEIVADLYLARVLGLYFFAGEDKINPEALTIKLIMAPLFGIIFLNYMPKKRSHFIPYWLGWTVFSTFFEWTTIVLGYLTYDGWKLWYSGVFFSSSFHFSDVFFFM